MIKIIYEEDVNFFIKEILNIILSNFEILQFKKQKMFSVENSLIISKSLELLGCYNVSFDSNGVNLLFSFNETSYIFNIKDIKSNLGK